MLTSILAVLLAAIAIVTNAAAQTAPLPKAMTGRWTFVRQGANVKHVQTLSDVMSVVLDAPTGTGAVTGRFTSRGVICGAVDEPLTGTWDGTELRFESRVRPNVNAARANGECGSGKITFVLKRKPGETGFEGESTRDPGSAPVQITLSP